MTAPTLEVRRAVYDRDGRRCVICGALELTFQHRRAGGQGGSKMLPPAVDGLTLCAVCNDRCEWDMQTPALAHGWKVRRWVQCPERVPVYYPRDFAWYRLDGVRRVKVSSLVAMEMGCSVYGDEWARLRAQSLFGENGAGS